MAINTQIRCPRCNKIVTFMPGTKDVVHDCNSGNPALDNEDVLKLADQPNWRYQGVENSLGLNARLEGENFEGVTRRGLRRTSYKQEKHYEFINL